MPWLIAAFLVMLFLIPFDGISFKVHLPMDAKPDRVLIALMIAVLAAQKLTGAMPRLRRRRTSLERAFLVYTAIALTSIVLNIDRIYQLDQLGFAEKTLSQFLGFVIFFFIVVATVRTEEFAAYGKLVLALACLTALGTLYEAHSGNNLFYDISGKLFSPIANVIPAPTDIHDPSGRPQVVGPTAHGLAVTSLLTMALPFAVLPLLRTSRMRARVGFIVVIGLILAAELATARKTAFVAPVAAFAVLIAYNRRLLRWSPLGLVALIPVIHFAAPGAIGTLTGILGSAQGSASTQGRLADYSAVSPDILSNLIIGRGYGTLDPDNYRWYRILDNEYLDQLFQVGIVGLLAYLSIIVSALTTAHRVIVRGGEFAQLTLAAAAGCAAFGLVSATFDAAGFPQAPYTFCFLAALVTVTAVRQRQDDQLAAPAAAAQASPRAAGGLRRRMLAIRPEAASSTRPVSSLAVYPVRSRDRNGEPADPEPAVARLAAGPRHSVSTTSEHRRRRDQPPEGTDGP